MALKPESKFRKKVLNRLSAIPTSFWESISQKSIVGTPDILGHVNGVFVALELKTEKGELTILQNHKLNLIQATGGIAFCVRPSNLEEVIQFLLRLSHS